MMQLRTRSGFSLLELIVYVGITALVVVSLTNVMITIFETRQNTQSVSEVQQTARFIFDRMQVSFLNAIDADITSPERIELTMPEGMNSPVVFSLNDGALYTRSGQEQAYSLSSALLTVEELTFSSTVEGSVTVTLTITDGKEDSMTLSTTYTLRH